MKEVTYCVFSYSEPGEGYFFSSKDRADCVKWIEEQDGTPEEKEDYFIKGVAGKEIVVQVTGFQNEDEAQEFSSWYEGQGEQDLPVWFDSRIGEGKNVRKYLNADCAKTYDFERNPETGLTPIETETQLIYQLILQ